MFTVFRVLLLTVEVISAFMLIGVILLQRSKQHGAGMMFGAGVGESLFGAQVGNVLTKATVILASIFLISTTLLAYLGTKSHSGSVVDRQRLAPIQKNITGQARNPAPPVQSEKTDAVFDDGSQQTMPASPIVGDIPVAPATSAQGNNLSESPASTPSDAAAVPITPEVNN